MARQGITQEQVFMAADELREEGVSPTVQTVRERIGSGSFSTINTHLGEQTLEEQTGLVETVTTQPDSEAMARAEAEKQAGALTIENARLEERAKAAEKWAGELKGQFEGLQEKLAEAVKQAATVFDQKEGPCPIGVRGGVD